MRANTGLAPDLSDEARAIFKRIVKIIGDRLRPEDVFAVSMLAQSWTDWQAATDKIDELGLVVMSGGVACQNPYCAIQQQAARDIRSYVDALGLSPAARKKLKLDTKAAETPAAEDWLQ